VSRAVGSKYAAFVTRPHNRLGIGTSHGKDNAFDKLTIMVIEYVQEKINYRFADCELLRSALKSAHASDKEGTSDDGNRGLAKIGVCVMDMVETHNAVVVESKTESKFTFHGAVGNLLTAAGAINSSDFWFKTKQGRASTCKQLGIAPCIVQSTRQQQEEPSTTVLANAMSAIFGAMWLDLESQNESVANSCNKVLTVLHGIESGNENTLIGSLPNVGSVPVFGGMNGHQYPMVTTVPNGIPANEIFADEITSMEEFGAQWLSAIPHDLFNEVDEVSLPLIDMRNGHDVFSANEAIRKLSVREFVLILLIPLKLTHKGCVYPISIPLQRVATRRMLCCHNTMDSSHI
jgi:hypothetical protein